MSVTRVNLQPGYLIHQRAYRDTSALLEVLTRDYGRVGLVARGARSARSRLRGILQPFRPLLLSWGGRGELGTLAGLEPGGAAPPVTGASVFSGFYLNELVLRLLARQDPHPEMFEAYAEALAALHGAGEEPALRLFEKRLLEALGYGLLLDAEADNGRPVDPRRLYLYHLERGPVAVDRPQAGLSLPGRSLLALHAGVFEDAESLRDAKRLLKAALSLYLGDRPLKTRTVLRQLRRR